MLAEAEVTLMQLGVIEKTASKQDGSRVKLQPTAIGM